MGVQKTKEKRTNKKKVSGQEICTQNNKQTNGVKKSKTFKL